MKTTAGLMVVGSVLGVFLAACCGGAGSKIKEAESATAEGRYDEAIAIYEQVLVEHPDSEKATLVPKAIEDTMLAKADSLFASGDFLAAGRAFGELADRFPDAVNRTSDVPSGTGLARAHTFSVHVDSGPTEGALDDLHGLWSTGSGPFKEVVGTWLCENRTGFPQYKICSDVSTDVLGSPAVEVFTRFEEMERSCNAVTRLKDVCGSEVDLEIAAIVGAADIEALGQRIDDAKDKYLCPNADMVRQMLSKEEPRLNVKERPNAPPSGWWPLWVSEENPMKSMVILASITIASKEKKEALAEFLFDLFRWKKNATVEQEALEALMVAQDELWVVFIQFSYALREDGDFLTGVVSGANANRELPAAYSSVDSALAKMDEVCDGWLLPPK